MSHDRDHDHQAIPSPRDPRPLSARLRPDYKRREHPTSEPREPIDPKSHPSREERSPGDSSRSSSRQSRDAASSGGDSLGPRGGR